MLTPRAGRDPARIEMEEDAKMAASAERMGRVKCVRIGCPTLLDPTLTPDGFCNFHRERSASTRPTGDSRVERSS